MPHAPSSIPPADEQNVGGPQPEHTEEVPLSVRLGVLAVILLPFAGLIAALVLLWGIGLSWIHLGLLLGMYVLTGLGVTVGYHRYFTHKAFVTPRPVQAVLGICGSMALEGPLLTWVATHRRHHQCSDRPGDPHSPHQEEDTGFLAFLRAFLHAHMGWMLAKWHPDFSRYVRDLQKDRLARTISRLFPLWGIAGLLLPGAVAGLVTLSWTGALLGVLWGGFVRVFFVQHLTWSINSACHLWGERAFRCQDESRNNFLFGILGFGEGWHNNHHAFPRSARHGLRWWQLDVSWLVIRALGLIGLARDIKLPDEERRTLKAA